MTISRAMMPTVNNTNNIRLQQHQQERKKTQFKRSRSMRIQDGLFAFSQMLLHASISYSSFSAHKGERNLKNLASTKVDGFHQPTLFSTIFSTAPSSPGFLHKRPVDLGEAVVCMVHHVHPAVLPHLRLRSLLWCFWCFWCLCLLLLSLLVAGCRSAFDVDLRFAAILL
jgi:hypothetical protein